MHHYWAHYAKEFAIDVGKVFGITFAAGFAESFFSQLIFKSPDPATLGYLSVAVAVAVYGWVFQATYRYRWMYTFLVGFAVWLVASVEIMFGFLDVSQWASSLVFVLVTCLAGCFLASVLERVGRIF